MAGITGAVLAIGTGLASGGAGVSSLNHALASMFIGVFTGGLVLTAMPLIEQGFKVATDATLFELTDFNHPLLRKMQVEAPGTYHHSLMVANFLKMQFAVGKSYFVSTPAPFFMTLEKWLSLIILQKIKQKLVILIVTKHSHECVNYKVISRRV